MNKLKQRLLLLALATATAVFADDDGFGFDDLDAVEAGEQQTLLQMAKEAANNYDFSKAQSLIEQAQNKAYAPDDVDSAKQVLASAEDKKQREDAEKARLAEEKRQRELAAQRQQQQQSSGGGSVYVVDWGVDFSGGDRLWGRSGVKLNNGKEVYMWLDKQNYGLKCYNLNIQGSFYASASFCDDNIESYSYWAASCGSGQFQVQGNHADVAKKLISRCGG